jgi:BRCT domain type II-containing protein
VKSYDKVPLFLEGYEVLVLNGSDAFSKAELEQKISAFGARIVQSPSDKQEEFIAVAGKDCGVRVKNFKALKTHDLLDADAWLQECQRLHSLPPPHSK